MPLFKARSLEERHAQSGARDLNYNLNLNSNPEAPSRSERRAGGILAEAEAG